MKLYYYPLSTYSQKVLIALNEKHLSVEKEIIDLMSAEARAAYAKVSPIGKVPFLRASDDWDVPESTSIIEYLEDEYPDSPRLIRYGDRRAARQVRFMDRMADLYYNDPVVELLFQQLGFRSEDADKADRARGYIAMTYGHLNRRLADRAWLAGDAFTMADCSLIPAMYYARTVAPFDDHANVAAYWERAQSRPSYAKVKAEFEPIWQGLADGRAA